VVRLDGSERFLVQRNGQPVWHDRIQVDVAGRDTVDATAVGADLATDLAVLRLDIPDLPAIQWADSDAAEIGTAVLALGFPFGVGYSASRGIISGTGRDTRGGSDSFGNYLQTDAAINPGNSGGPLIDLRGRVLGVNTSIYTRTGANIGIGFALPANLARRVAEDLIDDGVVDRPVLGLQILMRDGMQAPECPHRRAAVVSVVLPDSPAAQVDVRKGDHIHAIDGLELAGWQHFRSVVAAARIGQTLRLSLWRAGQSLDVAITPISGEVMEQRMLDLVGRRLALPGFGMELEHDGLGGLRIDRVAPDGPAARKGLLSGDRILAVEGLGAIQSLDQMRELDQRSSVMLTVLHQGRPYLIVLQK
jgi:S1-C subfamily serine protease